MAGGAFSQLEDRSIRVRRRLTASPVKIAGSVGAQPEGRGDVDPVGRIKNSLCVGGVDRGDGQQQTCMRDT